MLVLAIIIPAAALLGHLWVAYELAPRRAQNGILRALIEDEEFRASLLNAFFKPIEINNEKGEPMQIIPIDLLLSRAKEAFKKWIEEGLKTQGNEAQGAQEVDIISALISSSLPKKYRFIGPIVSQFLSGRSANKSDTTQKLSKNPFE